ncbi:MAG: glycosyltransferase family 87 protein [Acidobacteriota bacterium]
MIQTRSLVRFVIVMGFILVLLISQVPLIRSDFASFFAAATILRSEPSRLYDQDLQYEVQGRLGKSGYLPFAYPPLAALVFVPFSLLGFEPAYLAWLVASAMLLLLSLHVMVRGFRLSSSQADALLLFTLLFFPVYAALVQGQLSLVILLLFTLFLTEERSPRAGLWAGLVLIKPQLAPVPFLVLLLSRNWRGVAVGLAAGSIQLLMSFALVGLSGFRGLPAVLSEMANNEEVLAWLPRMHNLRQISWFLGAQEAGYFVLALLTAVVLSGAWARYGRSKWTILMAVLAACLVSPHLFLHDLTLALPAGAIWISTRHQELGYAWQIIWAAGALVTLLALYEYPIVSSLMLAGFGVTALKSVTTGSSRPSVQRPGTQSMDLTEVPPAARS